MLNTFRAHAGQFMKIAAIACALCLAMAALAGCSGSDSQQEKTPAQVNREYMSSVDSISQEHIKPGDKGITISRLAPMGKVKINGHTMEAKTADDFIDQNEEIVVLEVFKTNVLVEKWLG